MMEDIEFLCSVRWLLLTAKVLSSPMLVTRMMEALLSSRTSVLLRATRRNITELSITDKLSIQIKCLHNLNELKVCKDPISYAWMPIFISTMKLHSKESNINRIATILTNITDKS
jgi:hypothetical protein